MRKVIIDTDPGTDDALALMMALNSPDLDVQAITTVGGNATLAHTTRNALRLMEYLGATGIPIAAGASRPLRGSFTYAYHFHGSAGLGVRLPAPKSKPHGVPADEYIHGLVSAYPGEFTIIALGPLTNIAMVLQKYPELLLKIKDIFVMGGAVEVPGNVTLHAEFNIYDDPWAANIVFMSGVPVTLVGLDVTHQTYFHRDEGPRWFAGKSKSAQLGNRILTNRFRARPDLDEFHLHDPLAVAAVIEPDVLTYRQATVSVVTEGQERGRTVATYSDGPMKVAVGVDEGRAVGLVRNLIEGRA
jgi:purine nucleosidase